MPWTIFFPAIDKYKSSTSEWQEHANIYTVIYT